MDKKDLKKIIENKLKGKEKSIRNKNALDVFFKLIPPASSL